MRRDLRPFIRRLEAGETPGDRVQGTGHAIYKARLPNTDAASGKRGGYRVVYYLRQRDDILLVTIYSKADQSDLEASALIRIIQQESRSAG